MARASQNASTSHVEEEKIRATKAGEEEESGAFDMCRTIFLFSILDINLSFFRY